MTKLEEINNWLAQLALCRLESSVPWSARLENATFIEKAPDYIAYLIGVISEREDDIFDLQNQLQQSHWNNLTPAEKEEAIRKA